MVKNRKITQKYQSRRSYYIALPALLSIVRWRFVIPALTSVRENPGVVEAQ